MILGCSGLYGVLGCDVCLRFGGLLADLFVFALWLRVVGVLWFCVVCRGCYVSFWGFVGCCFCLCVSFLWFDLLIGFNLCSCVMRSICVCYAGFGCFAIWFFVGFVRLCVGFVAVVVCSLRFDFNALM